MLISFAELGQDNDLSDDTKHGLFR